MKTLKQITVATAIETKSFNSFSEFIAWDKDVNTQLIESYTLIFNNGDTAGNSGVNAGAYLYELMEGLGVWNIEMQFPITN